MSCFKLIVFGYFSMTNNLTQDIIMNRASYILIAKKNDYSEQHVIDLNTNE